MRKRAARRFWCERIRARRCRAIGMPVRRSAVARTLRSTLGGVAWSNALMVLADATSSAVIAGAAAVLGGLLTAFANRGVERLRLRAGLVEKAQERRLATLERFLLAANAWVDWLIFLEDQGWTDASAAELNARVKARDDAYRQLLLLASDDLFQWLTTSFSEAEYELKRTYASAVRYGREPDEEGLAARREFTRLLREDIVSHMRPEVAALREPVAGRSRH
jgi:hypothetical protein